MVVYPTSTVTNNCPTKSNRQTICDNHCDNRVSRSKSKSLTITLIRVCRNQAQSQSTRRDAKSEIKAREAHKISKEPLHHSRKGDPKLESHHKWQSPRQVREKKVFLEVIQWKILRYRQICLALIIFTRKVRSVLTKSRKKESQDNKSR